MDGARSLSLCPTSIRAGLRAAEPWAGTGHISIRSLKYLLLPKLLFFRLRGSSLPMETLWAAGAGPA